MGLLYDRHAGRILNVAYRVLGDWSRAQDVVQDVFLHLQDRIGTWRGEAGLQSWLYRITVNRAIDHRRREARRPAWRMGDTPLEDPVRRPRGDEVSPPPPDVLEREGERERVRLALEALSPKLRAVLVLRYQEGQSYEDLAEVLACSLGTVKSRLNRAHAAFKKAYEEQA